jgi:GNAT superfamily N-acetyltransferase
VTLTSLSLLRLPSMSAYGAIASQTSSRPPLASTIWLPKPSATSASHLLLHHLTLSRALKLPGLVDCLHSAFAEIIEEGATYPQEILQGEEYTRAAFEAYFFAGDVIVAIAGHDESKDPQTVANPGQATAVDLQDTAKGREWEECVVGFYYVGSICSIPPQQLNGSCRSNQITLDDHHTYVLTYMASAPRHPISQICNGGFVVPARHRGHGYGTVLAQSYLHYAPALGYEASVFNLVYVNNVASVR